MIDQSLCKLHLLNHQSLKLHNFLESSEPNAEKIAIIQKITEMLSTLAANNISHGDLKHSNILVLDSKPVLTDLDAMQVNRIKWLAQYRAARDMEKFINGARGNYDITNFLQKNAGQLTK